MPPQIRPAAPEDAAFAAPLVQATIGAIGQALSGEATDDGAAAVLAAFFARPGNRLSFGHTLILEEEGRPLGLAVLYPGDGAAALDGPFRERLRALGRPDRLDPEAQPGELYLDTLAVVPGARGRGLGATLLAACAARADAAGLPLALLAEEGNPAEHLYRRAGFVSAGACVVAGHRYRRLVRPAADAARPLLAYSAP